METIKTPGTFVIFGATGDLTKRKLIPAFHSLYKKGLLPDGFAAACIGRRDKDSETYRREMKEGVEDKESWDGFAGMIHYVKMDFLEEDEYELLKEKINRIEKKHDSGGNRIYYLAVAPGFFAGITEKLKSHGMLAKENDKYKVMVEKPFGSNLKDAVELNDRMAVMLKERNILRVDHYLGKEMIQNILSLRFGNAIFEPLWNKNFIEGVQIISTETIGVGGRGEYYDKAGVTKDMLQNHMLQMLALTAMEPPDDFSGEAIRDSKARMLDGIDFYDPDNPSVDIVAGQYGQGVIDGRRVRAYREEKNIPSDSTTPTFIALKAGIDNDRWRGVPFYILTGKGLAAKETKIAVIFKKNSLMTDFFTKQKLDNNILVIKIQPEEGVFFRINAKKPGEDDKIGYVTMNYCHGCEIEGNSPEAYERLAAAALDGNHSLFTRWDELKNSWEFTEKVEKVISTSQTEYPNYKAGGRGPEKALEMIGENGIGWCFGKGIENENI